MTDHSALIERMEAFSSAEQTDTPWVADELVAEAAAALRDQQDRHEGMEEDLYQAVLVAYKRGAVTWVEMNYPKWFGWIKEGRACLPSAPNQAKEAGE
jgi:hypothetical protein